MQKIYLLGARAFLLVLLSCCSILYAQTAKISGVVSSNNNIPIKNAFITINKSNTTYQTDEYGRYSIQGLSEGMYTVTVNADNYTQQSKQSYVKDNQEVSINFILKPNITELQTVEIIGRSQREYTNENSFAATKTGTALKDTPQSISYVTKEIMTDRQAYRVNDVVKNLSGVNQFSYYNDYVIRGFRSEQELVNGLRVIGLFGPQIITANLERVEVIKGPASAVSGNASPGGTMNRVTKKPLTVNRKAIEFTTGSYNTLRATTDFTGPLNEDKSLLYRLNLAYENSDSFRDLQTFKSFMVAPSISFLPTDKTKINFDLVITNFDGKLDRGQPIFGATAGTKLNSTPISFAIGAANDYHKTDVVYSTLSLNHKLTEALSFNTSYMRYTYKEDLFEHRTSNRFAVDSLGAQIPTLMGMMISARIQKEVTDNVSSYFVWDTQTNSIKHKILLGFDHIQNVRPRGGGIIFTNSSAIYRTKDGGLATYDPKKASDFIFENGRPKPNIPHFDLNNPSYKLGYISDYILDRREQEASKYYTQGFYLQDQIKWNKLQLLVGLRQEMYNDFLNYKTDKEEKVLQTKLLPRFGVVYSMTDDINLYGTYTESFQPQNPRDLLANQNEKFDPKEGHMMEVGAKGVFLNNRLSATLALYHIINRNILIRDPQTDLLKQRGKEKSQGFEVDINGTINKHLKLTANYAYNNATIVESDDPEAIGMRKENAPLHSGGFFANYEFTDGFLHGVNINLGSNFVTERNTFEKKLQLPGYTIFDAGISYKMRKVKLALTVNNITNKTHWVGGYSYARLFPGTPRSYYVNIGYTF